MKESPTLDPIFNPSAVAVIGASNDAVKGGGRFLKSLIQQFKGQVFPVNPNEAEVMGLKAYPTVREIPVDVDLAVIAIPAEFVPQAMADCAAKGVRFAIIYTVGFREVGAEGRRLEDRVLEIARAGGVRTMGPNCMGVFCPESGLNTIMAHYPVPMESGDVAVFGQSGWATESMVVTGIDRGLRFSKVVSIGNQIDLTASDYLEYFGDDPKTRVICAYLEGITDGQRFLNVARSVTRKKPVIIWKSGRTDAGARAVASHTGSLAGNDLVNDAAFKQAGIIRASNLEELVDFAVGFCSPYLPAGNRVGFIAEAGGGCTSFADVCDGLGLSLPQFSAGLQKELRERLEGLAGSYTKASNPVDMVAVRHRAYKTHVPGCLETMAKEVDTLLMLTYYRLPDETFARMLADLVNRLKKPLFVVPPYATREIAGGAMYTRLGVPVLPTPERAARAISALTRYAARA